MRAKNPARRVATPATVVSLFATALMIACGGGGEEAAEMDGDTAAVTAADSGALNNLITISLDPATGEPTVDKDSACGNRGHMVRWQGAYTDTTWLVTMLGASPFAGGRMTFQPPSGSGKGTDGERIDSSLAAGTAFAYKVQLITPDGDTLGADPEIIIKDPNMTARGCS